MHGAIKEKARLTLESLSMKDGPLGEGELANTKKDPYAQYMESQRDLQNETTSEVGELKSLLDRVLRRLNEPTSNMVEESHKETIKRDEPKTEETTTGELQKEITSNVGELKDLMSQILRNLDEPTSNKVKEPHEKAKTNISEPEVQSNIHALGFTNDSVVVLKDHAGSMNVRESIEGEASKEEEDTISYCKNFDFIVDSSDDEAIEENEILEEVELASLFSLCFEYMEVNDELGTSESLCGDLNLNIFNEGASEENEPLEKLKLASFDSLCFELMEVEVEDDGIPKEATKEEGTLKDIDY